MVKVIHLAADNVNERISKLQEELDRPETQNNKTKKKRLYAQLAQLKKAAQDPDNLLVDPEEEANRIKEDKEKRIQKKLEKKKEAILAKKKEKRYQKRCLKCGSRDHLLSECSNTTVNTLNEEQIKPEENIKESKSEKNEQKSEQAEYTQAGGFCYKCGSTEHSHKECAEQEYKLALCFYCGNKGHIARECDKNEKGLYRKGGSCFGCGSVRHILKDCPTRQGRRDGRWNNRDQY